MEQPELSAESSVPAEREHERVVVFEPHRWRLHTAHG